MVAVAPRPASGGALLYVRRMRPPRRQSGGIALHEGSTRRRHAARRLRMAQNPHHRHGERQHTEDAAALPMSSARALRPATGTSTTPEHNTTRPTTTTPGPFDTKLSLLTHPRRISGTKLAQHEPHGLLPVQNSPSKSHTAHFRYKTLPAHPPSLHIRYKTLPAHPK